jgi:hypothetical protein
MSHIVGPYTYLLASLVLSSYTNSFFFALVLGLIVDFVTAATTTGFWVIGYIDYALMIPIMIILGALAGLVLMRSFGFIPPIYKIDLPPIIDGNHEPQDIPFIRGILGMTLIIASYVPIELGRHTTLFSEWLGYLISLGAAYVTLFMAFWLTEHDPVLVADGNGRKLTGEPFLICETRDWSFSSFALIRHQLGARGMPQREQRKRGAGASRRNVL